MKTPPIIVALIATYNRPSLLARRSLPSIAMQARRPDMVVVVDDSLQQFRSRNKKIVTKFSEQSGIHALYLENYRHQGASGAWNAGALAALRKNHEPNRTYIAILDDDDEWLPNHLSQAEKLAQRNVDLIAAPFLRRERTKTILMRPPNVLQGNNFLSGNPGVGGSSLIFRLSAFCRAGMFDESMRACTDRDLCFRFSMLGNILYRPTKDTSIIHYADDNRERLSTPLSKNKLGGLTNFFRKYRALMTDSTEAAFRARAKKLFGWQLPSIRKPSLSRTKFTLPKSAKNISEVTESEKIALIVGVIIPPEQKDNPLFDDIAKLSQDKRLSSLIVVVMPSSVLHVKTLKQEISKWRHKGIRIYCINGKHATSYIRHFNITQNARKQRPIAVNRTILQHAVWRIAKDMRNPVCWILDGDSRLHGLAIHKQSPKQFLPDYIGEMIKLRNSKCDVAVGNVNGAAPLPRFATVRPQMIDLLFYLARLLPKNKKGKSEAVASNINVGDYYYDYGSHMLQEQLAGISPLCGKLTYRNLITALPQLINRILAGDAVTRPLLQMHQDKTKGIAPHRGGNTLIFNPTILRTFPNGLAQGVYADMRRADEIWRIIGESVSGWKVVRGNFPITQSRTNDSPQAPDIDRMAADIIGHAVSTGLRQIANKKRFADIQSFINCTLQNNFALFSDIEEIAQKRLSMVQASFYRICGIIESMQCLLASTSARKDKTTIAAIVALNQMKKRFSQNHFMAIEEKVIAALDSKILSTVLAEFPTLCKKFNRITEMTPAQSCWLAWFKQERQLNAVTLIQNLAITKKPIHLIGQGSEGTIFTDKTHVYKILHHWYARANVADTIFLLSLCGKWNPYLDTIYSITDYRRSGDDLLIVLPYEKTLPYRGGFGAGLTAMLADFKNRGIVLWNSAPKSMRVCGTKVRFIDYGNDIRPFTKKDFDLSVRKMWLCWRWADRSDLKNLLSAAITNPNLPELIGYENLKTAVMQYAMLFRPNETLITKILSTKPRRVFDFGCGKSKDAIMLAQRGIEVCAYDPEMPENTRKKYIAAGVNVLSYKQIKNAGVFDIVILHNVICEIASNKELRQCLNDVRGLTHTHGRVIVTACDVDGVTENTCATNILPRRFNTNKKFLYQKHLRKNGVIRPHVHRPSDVLLKEFSRSGFKVKTEKSFPDMDLNRFVSCGGTLQWVLTPIPHLSDKPSVTHAFTPKSNKKARITQ